MNYWLRLSRDTKGDYLDEQFVSLPFTWLWELPLVCWQLRKAWKLQERLEAERKVSR